MDRRSFLMNSAFLGTGSLGVDYSWLVRQKVLPRVLILGDSISIGYTPFVQELLKDLAEVVRPVNDDGTAENCEGTTKGVQELERWLGNGKWDVIHFNFGLHDLKHIDPETGKNSMNPKDPQQAPLKKYRQNLDDIVERLKQTGAHLIFATTTPYPNPVDGPLRKPGEPQKYNEAAMKLMKKHQVQVNDLYSYVKPQMEKLMIKKNVHFTEEGSRALAGEVVRLIKPVIMKNP